MLEEGRVGKPLVLAVMPLVIGIGALRLEIAFYLTEWHWSLLRSLQVLNEGAFFFGWSLMTPNLIPWASDNQPRLSTQVPLPCKQPS